MGSGGGDDNDLHVSRADSDTLDIIPLRLVPRYSALIHDTATEHLANQL